MGLIASVLALFGCDQRKVDEAVNRAQEGARAFWHSVQPDRTLFRGIETGVSTEEDVRRTAGRPDLVWEDESGARTLEYPRGPEGATTWQVTIGTDGRVARIEQVLTAENFARVRAGMSEDGVRRLLGRPTTVEAYARKRETVWSYRWWESSQQQAMFNVHFGADARVTHTSRSDDPSTTKGG
ncbi:outer membrane protein assembly factor BamE [Cupriavidus sp. AU9028]|uniref:outer membrane protein assembly factor BamE domain-containing protein n=1 Tax=Cupriavidus sp. AU9028 TaxID=2871157 RepID=UPI001C942B3F|nr:outer membrane protein assembly factor BamE [Cupriavidus sp. AU9028]MBY4899290.1 outer membrane protein assembly factor BamE [Cupriavidus sp. AU9028]